VRGGRRVGDFFNADAGRRYVRGHITGLTERRGGAIRQLSRLRAPRSLTNKVTIMQRQFRASQVLLERVDRLSGQSEMVLPILLEAADRDGRARRVAAAIGLSACAKL
jgi:hypothetical protein